MRTLLIGIFLSIAVSAIAVEYQFTAGDTGVLNIHRDIYNDTVLTDTDIDFVRWDSDNPDTVYVYMIHNISGTDKTRIQTIVEGGN